MRTRIALFAVVVSAGCSFDDSPGTASVTCLSDAECPTGFRCATAQQRCVRQASDDTVAPSLSATITPAVIRPDQSVTIVVTASEALGGPLTLEVRTPNGRRTVSPTLEALTFVYTPQPGDLDGALEFFASAEDQAGNGTRDFLLGSAALDGTPPRVLGVSLSPSPGAPGALIALTLDVSEFPANDATLVVHEPDGGQLLSTMARAGRPPRFEFVVPAGPSRALSLSVGSLLDRVGNESGPIDAGAFVLDADSPVIASPQLSGRRFSRQSGFDDVPVPVAVQGAVRVEVCLEADCRAVDAGVLHFAVTSADVEGSQTVLIRAFDDVGNRAERAERIEYDFTAPESLSASMRLIPPANCPFPVVSALGPDGQASVLVSVSERLGQTPVLSAGPLSFTTLDAGAASRAWEFTHQLSVTPATDGGTFPLELQLVDDVGNRAALSLALSLDVDVGRPAAVPAALLPGFIYRRVPWGSEATNGAASFSVTALPGTFEPSTHVRIWSEADTTSAQLLADVTSDVDGGLAFRPLAPVDYAKVYFSQHDSACNGTGKVAPAVPTVEWVATLNGKLPGQRTPNPNRFFDVPMASVHSNTTLLTKEWGQEVARMDSSRASSRVGLRWSSWAPRAVGAGNTVVCAYRDQQGRAYAFTAQGRQFRLTGSTWVEDLPLVGVRLNGPCTYSAELDRLIANGGVANSVSLEQSLVWFDGMSWSEPDNGTSPLGLQVLSWNPLLKRVIASDGAQSAAWSEAEGWTVLPQLGPTQLELPVMAFNAAKQATVLLGGTMGFGPGFPLEEYMLTSLDGGWQPFAGATPYSGNTAPLMTGGPGNELYFLAGQPSPMTPGGPYLYSPSSGWVPMAAPATAPIASLGAVGARLDVVNGNLSVASYDSASQAWSAMPTTAPGSAPWAIAGTTTERALLCPDVDGTTLMVAVSRAGLVTTWRWNGTAWSSVSGAPAYGASMAMAPDPVTLRPVVLSSTGSASTFWYWTGVNWRMHSVSLPSPRLEFSMVLDRTAGLVRLVGGRGTDAGALPLDEWVWDGGAWGQVAVNPLPQMVGNGDVIPASGFASAWDPTRGRIVLFGGAGASPGNLSDYTLELINGQFIVAATVGPSPRTKGQLAFDEFNERMVLFGGSDRTDTWEWDGREWTDLTATAGTPMVDGGVLTFSPLTNALVLADDRATQVLRPFGAAGQRFVPDFSAANAPGGFIPERLAFSVRSGARDGGLVAAQLWNGTSWDTFGTRDFEVDAGLVYTFIDAGLQLMPVDSDQRSKVTTDYVEVTVRYRLP